MGSGVRHSPRAIGSLLGPAIGFVAYFRPPPPERLAEKTYYELQKDVVALQKWVKDNREAAEHAEESCQAEADQLRRYVEGFTAGMSARFAEKYKRSDNITAKPHTNVDDVTVRQSAADRAPVAPVKKRRPNKLPKLSEPPPLRQFQQQLKMQEDYR